MDGVSEHLAFQASEVRASGRTLSGVAMPYNELSLSHNERFTSGAFGDLNDGQTRWLDLRHNNAVILADTASGRLTLTDTPDALRVDAVLPDLPAANAALEEVRAGRLTGFSVQFKARSERRDGGVRILDAALLEGIGLVGKPSYDNHVELREAASEVRIGGDGLAGKFNYNVQQTTAYTGQYRIPSFGTPRAKRGGTPRKVRVKPGSFNFALQDVKREITVVLGKGDKPLASRLGGSLELTDTPVALEFNIERLPDTSYVRDLRALLAAGAIVPAVVPFYIIPPDDVVPNASVIEIEEGTEDETGEGIGVQVISAAVLTALAVLFRPPRVDGETPLSEVERRAYQNITRRKIWL